MLKHDPLNPVKGDFKIVLVGQNTAKERLTHSLRGSWEGSLKFIMRWHNQSLDTCLPA